jgi:hypothetical protein
LTSKKQGSSPPHTTISYIPQILPDELLYSFLARLAAYNSFASPREYLRIFFGAKDIIPSVDLPTSLNHLHSCLGWQYPFESAQDIIDARTIYPYHRPFLTIERHERVQNVLLNGGGKGLKTLLGRVANRFGANPPLRYCARCIEADIREHRVPFWHRIHQLPAVSSCAIHCVDLTEHSWPSQAPDRQRLLLVPAAPKDLPAASGSSHVCFARISRDVLEVNLPALETEKWHATYETAASKRGFRDTNGRIAFEKLAKALRDHYGDFANFQHRERILSTPKHPLSWLRTIFGRPERSSHPVFHLLLIGFFFGSVGAFVRALDDAATGARKEQAKVRNQSSKVAIAGDSGDALYRNLTISSRKFAQMLHISVNTVISRRRVMGVTVVTRSKILSPDLRRLLENRLAYGDSPRIVATHFHVSLATVYRIRRESPMVLNAHARVRKEEERRVRRSRWLTAVATYSGKGVLAIRRKAPADYAWLYRHDREWLRQNLEKVARKRWNGRSANVDWNARDRQLCEQMKANWEALRAQPDRPRISKTRLLRPLGDAMVRRNLSRLPRLSRLIRRLEESSEDFQRHRIDQAINELQKDGLPLSLWRVQRRAGIRAWTTSLRRYAVKRISESEGNK